MCFSPRTFSAIAGSANVTNPKPRGAPVALSRMMTASVSSPYAEKYVRSPSVAKQVQHQSRRKIRHPHQTDLLGVVARLQQKAVKSEYPTSRVPVPEQRDLFYDASSTDDDDHRYDASHTSTHPWWSARIGLPGRSCLCKESQQRIQVKRQSMRRSLLREASLRKDTLLAPFPSEHEARQRTHARLMQARST